MPDSTRPSGAQHGRRTALKGLAAGAALLPVLSVPGQHAHPGAPSPAAEYTPKLITGATRELLTAVCDRIIPRTDTPGAADVGVADQIDWFATRHEGLAGQIASALDKVNAAAGGSFERLSEAEKDAVLTRMSADLTTDAGEAFTLLKNLTIDAYYTTREGLQTELGWNANTYLPEFKGCTHNHGEGVGE